MQEIPHWLRDESDEVIREDYRPIDGGEIVQNLVEYMRGRISVKYSYSDSGELIQAEEFGADGQPATRLLFERLPERPLEDVVVELASKTAETILKSVKKRSAEKPYRGLILTYSAEHGHCGLPHRVSVLANENSWPDDEFCDEHYTTELPVEFKRPVVTLLNEFNQRCFARFGMSDIDPAAQAAVDVMRRIGEKVYESLAESKHVTADFKVVVIDDHGDVESFAIPN
ncbi:MAG: hypothetical protein R3C18_16780 [Planctomycetaceae bacterium]